MTQRKEYSSRNADKFIVRFPEGMRPEVAKRAEAVGSSMNSYIIALIERGMAGSSSEIDQRIKNAVIYGTSHPEMYREMTEDEQKRYEALKRYMAEAK